VASPGSERVRIRATEYKLDSVVDVGLFVDEAEGLEQLDRHTARMRQLPVIDFETGVKRLMSADELDPGWDALPFKMRRLFNDWRDCSAGRSGARFSDHWFVSLSDYIAHDGERGMNLTPQWTFAQKLAEVDSGKGSDFDFSEALARLDRRVGVPFSWYFYMLHGNRVKDGAGRRVLRMAEEGTLDLPEHDYQVLRRWNRRPYGF
jgi:hypothetical protein